MKLLPNTRYIILGAIPICIFVFLFSCQSSYKPSQEISELLPERVDFNYHIKPILSDRCFKCHGPDANQREAELRLDNASQAFDKREREDGSSFYPLIAGNATDSDVFQRIMSENTEYMMPPPESNLMLTEFEKAMIAKWIDQGAEYKDHWSFVSPQKPTVPESSFEEWSRNPIDNFIAKELQNQGLSPSKAANKETLLRRITLDLTGLPPTPEEIAAFTAVDSDDAYEKAIDRLLESPHFGERMALEWLDVARYADSHGYQDDGMRNTWPWRDWVIRKFNENMPYDQFLLEQLAGDLLPEPSKDQLLATCFNRNHPQSQEGGVVDEEYRVEYVVDRTNTFGKALMGITVECAQCHDHKYDPISQEDYYSLYAYFNNNNDAGIVPYNGEAAPTVMLPTAEENQKLAELRAKMKPLEAAIEKENYVADLKRWLGKRSPKVGKPGGLKAEFSFEKELTVKRASLNLDGKKSPGWAGIGKKGTITAYFNKVKGRADAAILGDKDRKPELVEGVKGKGLKFRGDAGIRFNRDMDFDRYQPFSVSIWVKVLKEGEKGPIFNNTNGDFEGYRGWICKLNPDGTLSFQLNYVWPDNCIDYKTTEKVAVGEWTHIVMTYDGSSQASGLKFFVNGKVPTHKLLKDNLNKSLQHGVKGSNWSSFPFMLGREKERSIENIVMDELKVYERQLSELEVLNLFDPKAEIEPSEYQWLEYYVLSGKNNSFNQNLKSLTKLREEENLVSTDILEVMVMKDRKEVRPTFILDRGQYDAPTTEVNPRIPSVFASINKEEIPQNRLGLAKWLVSPEHPLTARVAVNRLWIMLFGKGLVETQGDFGNQGRLPSHPELLDWLAMDFIEKDWDIKAFMKQVMMSATYRQASVPTEKALEIDPENDWYSHFPSYRLPAEIIRDNALAASGLLSEEIGGPSVYPYQPDGIWAALATRNATKYVQGEGDELYRRSMYTIWKRSSPPPSMMNFDAPDRYYCVVKRQKTATPLQSLVLMNDPQFLEASKMLASRTLKDIGGQLSDRVEFMYLSLLGRSAREEEQNLLAKLYQAEFEAFSKEPERIEKLLAVGEMQADPNLDQDALAAHTILASTIMNFDEFVIKR
ncbi:MAG: DUF1553 domain-containing protein [Bacteroidota bacterium]